jgi:hypothetical protein
MQPDKLHFEIGGFFGENHEIEWRDGYLWYRYTENPSVTAVETEITPEPAQWERFWREVEAAEIWQWRPKYDSDICDSTQWSLEIQHGDRRVACYGSNAYPGSTAQGPDYSNSVLFKLWLKALRRLTGQRCIG